MKHVPLAVALALIALAGPLRAQDPLVTEGVVDAPPDSVWKAFTTAAGLESWMAPHASVDLRIGGVMQAVYAPDAQVGGPSTIENTILAYEPTRMLAIRVSRAPEGFPFPNAVRNIESLDGGSISLKGSAAYRWSVPKRVVGRSTKRRPMRWNRKRTAQAVDVSHPAPGEAGRADEECGDLGGAEAEVPQHLSSHRLLTCDGERGVDPLERRDGLEVHRVPRRDGDWAWGEG